MSAVDWTPWALAAVSPVSTLALAVWGFRRTSRADRLRMFLDLQERYLSEPARAGRRLIHERLRGADARGYAALDPAERSRISYALATMDAVAIACEGGHVDRHMVVGTMGRSFASAMDAAGPYLAHLATVRGYPPYQHAVLLAAHVTGRLDRVPAQSRGPRGKRDPGRKRGPRGKDATKADRS